MRVMIANNNGLYAGYLAGKYPGILGHLYSPGSQRGPYHFLPYALDNGKFPCWSAGKQWDKDKFTAMLQWAKLSGQKPLWTLVPDEVAQPVETLRLWKQWSPILSEYGWPLAFAAQDGHTPKDVPDNADVVFVGGTSEWKRKNIKRFCDAHPRVHVGRINSLKWLNYCASVGAESCDGTGWFRGDKGQLEGLECFLEEQAHGNPQQHIFANRLSLRQRESAESRTGEADRPRLLHGQWSDRQKPGVRCDSRMQSVVRANTTI